MAWIENATYENEAVTVDGKSFRDCSFNAVTLVYSAGILPKFENCTFNNIKLDFSQEADNTLLFLSGLYRGGFSHRVEAIFDAIRSQRARS